MNGKLGLSNSSYFWIDAIFKLVYEAKKIDPDIIHAHGTESWYSISGCLTRKPLVISLQGIVSKLNIRYYIFNRILSYLEKNV